MTKTKLSTEDVVRNYLIERRRKKGIHQGGNLDTFEMKTLDEYGIEYDYRPGYDDGEQPEQRNDQRTET